jgi:hypothetical protein
MVVIFSCRTLPVTLKLKNAYLLRKKFDGSKNLTEYIICIQQIIARELIYILEFYRKGQLFTVVDCLLLKNKLNQYVL